MKSEALVVITIVLLTLLLLVAGCAQGPVERCRLALGKEVTVVTGRCPFGMLVIGQDSTALTCAEPEVLCPVTQAK